MSTHVLRPGSAGAPRRGHGPSPGSGTSWGASAGPLPPLAARGQQDGAPVGSRGSDVRLQQRPTSAPPRLRLGGQNFGSRTLRSNTGDCAQVSQDRRSGAGSNFGTGKRHIPNLFSSGEENAGRVAGLSRRASGERGAQARALQDGRLAHGASAHTPRRLDDNFGHHRSLPSPPHSSRATSVLPVSLGRCSLPVPRAVLRCGTGASSPRSYVP